MSEPDIGSILGGKYRIEGVLGRGGMGVVYAAHHLDLDEKVAIKCLLPHALAIPEVVERFAREARAAVKIKGEHVARVIDVGRFDDGTPFMIMEFMTGHDLAQELLRVGVVGVSDAVRYVLEACEALAQAHALRIVHRDLKPANLFLAETPGRKPIVKVLDFGISKVVDASGGSLTKTASVMGTPYYMSPEQLLSAKLVDERCDVWALGIILYELLTGSPPFTAETAPEIIALIVQNQPRPPREVRDDIPQALSDVILRCLRTKPDERYADVAHLAAALQPFAGRESRDSILAIARVLGVTPDGLVDPPSVPQPAPGFPAGQGARAMAQGAAPATGISLTVSASGLPQPGMRRLGWVLGLVGVACVAVLGVAIAYSGTAPPAASATGLVATATATETTPTTALPPAPPPTDTSSAAPPARLVPAVVMATSASAPLPPPPMSAPAGGHGHHGRAAGPSLPPAPAPRPVGGPAPPVPSGPPAPPPSATCTTVTEYGADGLPIFKKVCK